MLISLLLVCLIALGGLATTYLIDDDEPLMWRLAAGSIIGSTIFGLAAFVLALAFGLTSVVTAAALVITIAPLALLWRGAIRRNFLHDWAKAKGKLQGGNLDRFAALTYYAFFIALFWFFFGQAMYQTPQGIFTGGSQNLGDLPFHLGAIFSFTDGANFPPQNPSWAGARFSYPFIADLLTACFIKLGAGARDAMVMQDLTWGFSLLIVLERFVARATGSKLAGRIAPFLLFFSGGLGFVTAFRDYWAHAGSITGFLSNLPQDYTINDTYRWGDPLVTLFITQRSLLMGMPLTMVVLQKLYERFSAPTVEEDAAGAGPISRTHTIVASFLVGLLAGTLPLVHLHSLVVLFVVTGCLFVFRPARWRDWIAFGVGVCLIAVPELVWTMIGTATDTSKFLGWHFGWDHGDQNVFLFWIKNTGLILPLIAAGIYLFAARIRRGDAPRKKADGPAPDLKALLLFYVPFALLFVISNVAKLAPWEWDNIKVLIYWLVGSLPLVAYALAWLWAQNAALKATAGVAFIILTLAGGLDVWRTVSGQNKVQVFDADAVAIAEQIKAKTPPNAVFLNAPTYNSAVVLSGRLSFMRYSGHLLSYGIDYSQREDQTRRIYEGGGVADMFLRQSGVDYVLVSPEERNDLKARDETFMKYPMVAQAGQYSVYKVK